MTAQPETDPDRIRALLAEQLVSPVRSRNRSVNVAGMGIEAFIEIGPRSVLAALVRTYRPGLKVEVITNDEH